MKKVCMLVFLSAFCSLMISAQGLDRRCWLQSLNDSCCVASLSVPGAHDAATGEGLYMVPGLGKSQELSLSALWDCGVRAFDLRPAVDDEELHIYHGIAKTKISFADALSILCGKLAEYPSEFAIVLLRDESESENSAEHARWPGAVGRAIAALGDKAAIFSPAMKIGDARGKIIFLSRNEYVGSNRGAVIKGWNHLSEGNTGAEIISYADDAKAPLQLQDYYAPTNKLKQQIKNEAVLRYLRLSAEASSGVWTINFLSGYCNRLLGFTPFATTAGYKRNAERVHRAVLNALASEQQATGIMMLDFAGCNTVGGGICHWSNFDVLGAEIVRKIIEQNFDTKEKLNDINVRNF